MTTNPLKELDESLKKLRTAYEKYFCGVERVEPTVEHDAFKKTLRRMLSEPSHNTTRRFYLHAIQASLNTHEQYWRRICRQIEEGTYKRHQLRVAKSSANVGATTTQDQEVPSEISQRDEPPPQRATVPLLSAAPKPTAGVSDDVRRLHQAYANAWKQAGARQTVDVHAFAKTLQTQAAAIKAKYKCRAVAFRVVLKDGKPILKAMPK